jgi:hypothetical protein
MSWSTAKTINTRTASTYTIAASDAGKIVTTTNSSAVTITIDTGTLTAGQTFEVLQLGAGAVTFYAAGGVSINSLGSSLISAGQYSLVKVICIASDTYVLTGDLA